MYRVRLYFEQRPHEQHVSLREFQTPEAAALYAITMLEDPQLYADEDAASKWLLERADLRGEHTFVIEPASMALEL